MAMPSYRRSLRRGGHCFFRANPTDRRLSFWPGISVCCARRFPNCGRAVPSREVMGFASGSTHPTLAMTWRRVKAGRHVVWQPKREPR